ncbi:hypothetical protein Q7P37_006648 [Cladosporium fusiforme]
MHSGTQAAEGAGLLFALPLLSWLDAMRDRGDATGPACSPRHVLARPDYLVACNTAALADADAHAVLCGAVRGGDGSAASVGPGRAELAGTWLCYAARRSVLLQAPATGIKEALEQPTGLAEGQRRPAASQHRSSVW